MENIYKNFNNINSFIFNDKSNILFKKANKCYKKVFLQKKIMI